MSGVPAFRDAKGKCVTTANLRIFLRALAERCDIDVKKRGIGLHSLRIVREAAWYAGVNSGDEGEGRPRCAGEQQPTDRPLCQGRSCEGIHGASQTPYPLAGWRQETHNYSCHRKTWAAPELRLWTPCPCSCPALLRAEEPSWAQEVACPLRTWLAQEQGRASSVTASSRGGQSPRWDAAGARRRPHGPCKLGVVFNFSSLLVFV